MSVEESFAEWIAAQDEAGTPMSGSLRGPVSERILRRVARRTGTIPDDVVALHRLADGVDERRWRDAAPGFPYAIAPDGPEFIDLETAARTARDTARLGDRSPVSYADLDESELWPDELGLAYPIWPGEWLAVETGSVAGRLWVVRWEADDIRPLDVGVEGLLDAATERLRRLGSRWDPERQVLDFDIELAEQLPPFPG